MKLGVYIVPPEPISTAFFINPSDKSLCLHVYPSLVAMQRHGKHVPAAKNAHNNGRIVGRLCLCICLCFPVSIYITTGWKTFPQHRIFVGGAVFYEIRVIWKQAISSSKNFLLDIKYYKKQQFLLFVLSSAALLASDRVCVWRVASSIWLQLN
jgi:hypothetical protein